MIARKQSLIPPPSTSTPPSGSGSGSGDIPQSTSISTDGIDIGNWKPSKKGIEFQTWDFAGQQIFCSTHSFFLSHGSIYLIVFSLASTSYMRRIQYWVHQIKALLKERSVVIFVGTHLDDPICSDHYLNLIRQTVLSSFQHLHYVVQIIDCIFVSTIYGTGMYLYDHWLLLLILILSLL